MILSSSYDGLVRLWDLDTGRCLRTIIDEPNPPVAIGRFTPNSRYIVIGVMDSRIDLWDYELQKKLKSYTGEAASMLMYGCECLTTGLHTCRPQGWHLYENAGLAKR